LVEAIVGVIGAVYDTADIGYTADCKWLFSFLEGFICWESYRQYCTL